MALLVRQPVSDHRNKRLVLPHALTEGGEGVARPNPDGFPFRVEGVEVYYPLEAAERELRELDRADGDAIEGFVSKGRGGAVPASASIFQEPRTFGVLPRHAAALLSLRLRVSPQELVQRRYLPTPVRA